MFYFDEINGKKILKSNMLENVNAFFTTRDFCIFSKENNNSDEIINNRKILTNYLKIKEENLITCVQTHGKNIKIANVGVDYQDTDSLILTQKNAGIFLNFADCTPVILYDKNKKIGAVAHAGWRGTVEKIGQLTVIKMMKEFSSNPEDIIALIGPCIGQCCFNVGEEVAQKLVNCTNNGQEFCKIQNDIIFVDLKGINKSQLEEIGVRNIDVCPYCTVCNNDDFYSYRKENKTPYRHSAILAI